MKPESMRLFLTARSRPARWFVPRFARFVYFPGRSSRGCLGAGLERLIYRLCGTDPAQMTWKHSRVALLVFNAFGALLVLRAAALKLGGAGQLGGNGGAVELDLAKREARGGCT